METCRRAQPKGAAPGGPTPNEVSTIGLSVRFDGDQRSEAQHVCDYEARKDAGERSRLAGLRRKSRRSTRYYECGKRRYRGNHGKCEFMGYGASHYERRMETKKYAASVTRRCRSLGFVPSLEVTWEGIEDSEGSESESDSEGTEEMGAMPEWMHEEMAAEDELVWALAASAAADRPEGAGDDGGKEDRGPAQDCAGSPSVCSSEGWEVVDASFDVRSVDDFELR